MIDEIKIAKGVIEFKIRMAEERIEERLNPYLKCPEIKAYLRKKMGYWNDIDKQLAQMALGEQGIREMQVQHYYPKVIQAEEELKKMEAGNV